MALKYIVGGLIKINNEMDMSTLDYGFKIIGIQNTSQWTLLVGSSLHPLSLKLVSQSRRNTFSSWLLATFAGKVVQH